MTEVNQERIDRGETARCCSVLELFVFYRLKKFLYLKRIIVERAKQIQVMEIAFLTGE